MPAVVRPGDRFHLGAVFQPASASATIRAQGISSAVAQKAVHRLGEDMALVRDGLVAASFVANPIARDDVCVSKSNRLGVIGNRPG